MKTSPISSVILTLVFFVVLCYHSEKVDNFLSHFRDSDHALCRAKEYSLNVWESIKSPLDPQEPWDEESPALWVRKAWEYIEQNTEAFEENKW